jgi:hypothetical protein
VGMHLIDTVYPQDRMVLSQCQARDVVNLLLVCLVQMLIFNSNLARNFTKTLHLA